MRVHTCGERGCRKIVSVNQRYCDGHKKKFEYHASAREKKAQQKAYNTENRNEEANQFYQSKEWKKVRNYVISRDMNICQVCGNSTADRKIVDHVHPLSVSGEEKLDSVNLWTLCYRCHSIKTKLEHQIASKSNGENILKHMTKERWRQYIKERIK